MNLQCFSRRRSTYRKRDSDFRNCAGVRLGVSGVERVNYTTSMALCTQGVTLPATTAPANLSIVLSSRIQDNV